MRIVGQNCPLAKFPAVGEHKQLAIYRAAGMGHPVTPTRHQLSDDWERVGENIQTLVGEEFHQAIGGCATVDENTFTVLEGHLRSAAPEGDAIEFP